MSDRFASAFLHPQRSHARFGLRAKCRALMPRWGEYVTAVRLCENDGQAEFASHRNVTGSVVSR